MKDKKTVIDNAIYIKVFSDLTVSYLTVSTGGILNTNNNETSFTELRRVCEEAIDIRVQEGYILK